MEPRTQTSAGMESVNETVERAKAMVSTSSDTQAPSVSTLEAAPQRLSVPERPTTVTAMEEFTSVTPEMLASQRALDEKRNVVGGQGQDLYEGLLGLGTKGSATIEAERQAGIPQLSTDLTEIENELSSKMLRFRRDREKIEQGTGLTANQKSQTLSEVSRVQNRELADLETIRAARSNSLTNAQNLVNRKVELEFGDKIAQVNALKFIYDENKQTLTKDEDKLFQQTIKREERAFEVAKTQFVQLENEKAKYLTNAAQAGADNNTLKTIQGAKSMDELYSMEGIQKYSMSQAEKLDMAYKNAQIASLYDQINARGVAAYEAQIEAAKKAKEQADAGLQKSLAGAALALELQTADGLSSAIGFGIKKNAVSRTAAGAGTGAAIGAGLGSVVPIVGTVAGGVVGGIVGGATGFFTNPEAIAGSARADYEAKADQLAAMITLEGRSALRGQGTITDSEQELLARAETILSNKNVSEDVWMSTLQQTAQVLNKANKEYARLYGGIPEELGSIYGIGADGLPAGASMQIDNNGNVIIPGSSQLISNEDFFAR